MNIYRSKIYEQDLIEAISHLPFLSEFNNKSIMITGGTGLIGSALVDLLMQSNDILNGRIHVYVAARNERGAQARFCKYIDNKYFHIVSYDASKVNRLHCPVDYIIHAASNASPVNFQKYPIETMLDNFCGLYELLEYAYRKSAKGVLFVSSSEVYGQTMSTVPFCEDEYGYIDILDVRSAYPSGKRAAETLCAAFAKEKGLRTVIVRPGHIYGPTARRSDNRVSSAFAYAAADGTPLILKSDGAQIRSYCYMLDAVTAILTVLLKGENAHAYNISNPDSIISIKEMTELLAKIADVPICFEKPAENENKAFNPMLNSSLNSDKLQALGWKGYFNAHRGFSHTVNIIRESL